MTLLYTVYLYSGNCSTCFGWYLHPSSEAHTTVSTASGICHTVTATCRYRGRIGTGLSVLWVAYATHNILKPVPSHIKPNLIRSAQCASNYVHTAVQGKAITLHAWTCPEGSRKLRLPDFMTIGT